MQTPVKIEHIITDSLASSTSAAGFLLGVAEYILGSEKNLELLENYGELSKALQKAKADLRADGSQGGKYGEIEKQAQKEQLIAEALLQGKILHCPHIDEHSVLLAALKKLDELGTVRFYKETLKQMLRSNIHLLDKFQLDIKFVGREQELAEAKRVLARSSRNNLLIIGPVGAGKTTLARAMHTKLPGLKLMQLFAGSDSFFDQIVSILSHADIDKLVFFLDEMFTFDPSQIKYLIDHSQVIGTANIVSYKRFAAQNPHIVSKFEIMDLSEPPQQEVEDIMLEKQKQLEKAGYSVDRETLAEVYRLGKQYIPDISFPAKAINILEEAAAYTTASGNSEINAGVVKALVSQKTGIPLGSLTDLDKKDLSDLPQRIGERVKGQYEAVASVCTTIQRSRLGFKKPNKPIGSFLFVGPSGVGKTELAKAVAKEVFGDEQAMIRLDMSEFAESHMVQRLIGSPPGYIGFEEGGQLTNPIKAKPYSLVLLDELEKAHPRVFDIFLQVLDDGRLTDGAGQQVDFSNTIIIATSNAGIEDMLDLLEEGKDQSEIGAEVREILQDYFRIEFINRFDSIVVFNSLSPKALVGIAKNQLEKLKLELAKKDMRLEIEDELIEQLAKQAHDPRFGARGLLRLLQEKIEDVLAQEIISGKLKPGGVYSFKAEVGVVSEALAKAQAEAAAETAKETAVDALQPPAIEP
jgi:ATP-dependent Clp protease ATP-binding subunit ClpA